MGTNESKLTSSDYRSAANKVRKALLEIDLGADIEHLAVLGVAHMEAEADRLDTEERTDTESFSFLNELAGAFRSGESNPRPSHFPVLEGIRAVLAHLHSAGRLLADGETPFTAEQVEDVRLLAHSVVKTNRGAAFEAMDRLRALLPATEPAEERRSFPTIQDVPNNTLFHTHGGNGSSLFVRNLSGDLRLCLNAGTEWSKLLKESDFPPSSGPYIEVPWSKFPQPWADPFAVPAPAEPAEDIRGLIEKSSLGTESAQALISTVSPEHGRRVAQEAARREAGTKVKLTELQRDLLQRIVDQWTKGAGWTHVFWSGTVEALISAGCIVRHEEAFNEYRPTIFGEKALAPAEPAEEETKAEGLCEYCNRPEPSCHAWRCAGRKAAFERSTASSPVVPAPTETEWATVVEIPVGAAFRPAGYTGPSYIIKTALGYRITPNGDHRLWNGAPVGTLAPFVAAEEG